MLIRETIGALEAPIETLQQGTVITLGNFDGVHIGHRTLIAKAREEAARRGLTPVIFTFWPHTGSLIPNRKVGCIYDEAGKYELLEQLAPEAVIAVFRFDEALMHMPEERFFGEILEDYFHAKAIVAGEDLRYGAGGRGDLRTMKAHCEAAGIDFYPIPDVICKGKRVSSTQVRELLETGEIEYAAELLGAPYTLTGEVFVGKRLGRRMGFPTANIYLPEGAVSPRHGVYVTRVTTPYGVFGGMTNVGLNPTVEHGDRCKIETHLFDFAEDLYGQSIRLEFLRWMRPETRFNNVDELAAQLKTDIEACRSVYFSN